MDKTIYIPCFGEFFCPIPGYERYMVSNFGTVVISSTFQVVRPSYDTHGYLKFNASKNGNKKTLWIHKLVCDMFCYNSNNKPVVNHLDGIKDNTSWGNLQHCTHSENTLHAINAGLIDYSSRKWSHAKRNAILSQEQVAAIKLRLFRGERIVDIAKDYPVGVDAIRAIKSGKSWK
ncbi:MAG: HNH endonuclease [Tannerellaceae bacterium]|nr:HNH endonuclease [Tannerellaceae bacterium]